MSARGWLRLIATAWGLVILAASPVWSAPAAVQPADAKLAPVAAEPCAAGEDPVTRCSEMARLKKVKNWEGLELEARTALHEAQQVEGGELLATKAELFLADALWGQQRYDEAATVLQHAIEVRTAQLGPNALATFQVEASLTGLDRVRNDPADGIATMEKMLAANEEMSQKATGADRKSLDDASHAIAWTISNEYLKYMLSVPNLATRVDNEKRLSGYIQSLRRLEGKETAKTARELRIEEAKRLSELGSDEYADDDFEHAASNYLDAVNLADRELGHDDLNTLLYAYQRAYALANMGIVDDDEAFIHSYVGDNETLRGEVGQEKAKLLVLRAKLLMT